MLGVSVYGPVPLMLFLIVLLLAHCRILWRVLFGGLCHGMLDDGEESKYCTIVDFLSLSLLR